MSVLALMLVLVATGGQPSGQAAPDVLRPGRTIALPGVTGRIDHGAYDPKSERLFIAALGNGSLEVLDLAKGARIKSVGGLKEPQGVAFIAAQNAVAVACGGDGSLHLYDAGTLEEKAHGVAGDDADNVRLDEKAGVLWVGVGDGALAGFEAATLKKTIEIPLKGHPESFQLDGESRVFINVPEGFVGGRVGGSGMVVAADRAAGTVTASVELKGVGRNFPMALDGPKKRLYVGWRRPARLVALDIETLAEAAKVECVGDADEVFVEGGLIYVVGGDGAVDVFEDKGGELTRVASVKTESGARTGALIPQRHALYVAVPARGGHGAEVREYLLGVKGEHPEKTPDVPAPK